MIGRSNTDTRCLTPRQSTHEILTRAKLTTKQGWKAREISDDKLIETSSKHDYINAHVRQLRKYVKGWKASGRHGFQFTVLLAIAMPSSCCLEWFWHASSRGMLHGICMEFLHQVIFQQSEIASCAWTYMQTTKKLSQTPSSCEIFTQTRFDEIWEATCNYTISTKNQTKTLCHTLLIAHRSFPTAHLNLIGMRSRQNYSIIS